jgi:hypothetical protein
MRQKPRHVHVLTSRQVWAEEVASGRVSWQERQLTSAHGLQQGHQWQAAITRVLSAAVARSTNSNTNKKNNE